MKVKTYFGETLQIALKSAKEELGDEIILLESQDVHAKDLQAGSRKMVKVTVGLNDAPPSPQQRVRDWTPPAANAPVAKPETRLSTPRNDENNFTEILAQLRNKTPQDTQKDKKILDEISMLRQELNRISRASRVPNYYDFPAPFASIYSEMEDRGVAADLAYQIVKRTYIKYADVEKCNYSTILNEVKSEMAQILHPFDFTSRLSRTQQQVILLLGSTGVGKSTTTMKIAANQEMFGRKDVGIISSDPYGPSEPLKAFAKITGTRVVEAKTFEEMRRAKDELRDKEVVLVDTPGRSPFAPNHMDKLERYMEILKPTDLFLVLSMATDTRDLFLSCGLYSMLNPTGLVFTKFDETSQPGKVFSVLEEVKLPVVCFSGGKRIFIDIAKGTPEFMFKKIFDAS